MSKTMGMLVWDVLPEEFTAVWNSSASVDEAALAIRALAGGPAPRWAVIARAGELRKAGLSLKRLESLPKAS